MEKTDHNKIIKAIAKKSFIPYGIKQKGQSRSFIDDNGWYIIIIGFQPSKYGNGTYLNIGINFNWYVKDFFSFDIGGRENNFVEYINVDQYTKEINKLCDFSIQKIIEYRNKLKKINEAENYIINYEYTSDDLWGNYHRGIISGIVGNKNNMNKYFNKLLNENNNNFEWIIELMKRVKELKDIGNNNLGEYIEKIKAIIKETRKLNRLDEIEIIL
ncbi:MAG: hypothetical protein LBC70_09370 [Chitinispirillales bacterium]|jgi:hypothetical protein|nr:hypothetical protein [Chitinispirillales bacterium]